MSRDENYSMQSRGEEPSISGVSFGSIKSNMKPAVSDKQTN